MKYQVVVSLYSDPGCVRETNEDAGRYVDPKDERVSASKGALILVADGMGGHAAGEIASHMAVEIISRAYYDDPEASREALERAFLEANRQIRAASHRESRLEGMGTTCTALVLRDDDAMCAHVGDSRLYLIRGTGIYRLTEDHSVVMDLVKRGLLTREQARQHSERNVINRALGPSAKVEIFTWNESMPIGVDDTFVICTDGLHDLIQDDEILREVDGRDVQIACQQLVDLAKARGGHDNITVGVLRILDALAIHSSAPRSTRELGILP